MSGYWDLDPLLDLLVLLLAVLSPLWLPLFEWVLVDVCVCVYIYIYIYIYIGRVYSIASYRISYSVATSIYDNFIY
jgi:hypothetical protein